MIELQQQDNLIIGSKAEIDALEKKDHSRILVASDSHNHFAILKDILVEFGKKCDCFAFCGDGLSDIANIYSLAKADEEFRQALPPVIAFVQGNCDPSSYPITTEKEIKAPGSQIIKVNGHNIMITHGHREGIDYGFENYGLKMKMAECEPPCTTGLFGHTHIAEEYYESEYKFINPGSCSAPRGGQPKSFAILTVEKTFIDTAFIKINSVPGKKDSYSLWKPQ